MKNIKNIKNASKREIKKLEDELKEKARELKEESKYNDDDTDQLNYLHVSR